MSQIYGKKLFPNAFPYISFSIYLHLPFAPCRHITLPAVHIRISDYLKVIGRWKEAAGNRNAGTGATEGPGRLRTFGR